MHIGFNECIHNDCGFSTRDKIQSLKILRIREKYISYIVFISVHTIVKLTVK